MNFAQVCGVVTCAVMAVMGCGDDREAASTSDGAPAHQAGAGEPRGAPPGASQAADVSATTKMGTPATIDLITDPHAAQIGERVVTGYSQPAHGRVTLIGPRAIYTPTPGYTGSDHFRYTITDAGGHTSSARAQVFVAAATPSCSITIAGPSSAMIGPAIHLTATASCDISTPEIQWQHRFGTTTTFSTFQNFSTDTSADFTTTSQSIGTHQFRARVRAQGTTTVFLSNTLTTSLVANTTPCTAVVLDTPATGAVFAVGQAIALHATATCPVGVVPEFQYLAMQPTDTGFTALPGTFPGGSSYTPPQPGSWVLAAAVRASGSTDPFQLQSDPVTISVSHAPTAVDDTVVMNEDTTGTVNVLANDSDPDGDPLTATITAPPAAGTASISAGIVTYHPAANYNGSDAIGYTVDDGHGNTATATVHITVNPVEDPPSAQHDFLTVAEDGSGALDVTADDTDPDGDVLTVVSFTQPSHGTASFTGDVATYTPAAHYTGSDEFEYTIDDGHGATSTASVFVTVTASNDAPIAVDDTLITPEDTEGGANLLGNDSDPDGDILTVVAFTQPLHGTASVVAGLASYIPAPNYNGPDAFSYTVADPSGATATATVHVTVVPVDDPPVAVADSASLDEDTTATIDVAANDSDVDGDVLAIASVTQPAHGTVAIVSGHEVTYTPAANYNGADSFTYTIADPSGASATATVTLAIAAINDPPVAVADAVSLDEDTAVTIDAAANDSDVDGDALAITAIAQPAHGTAAIVDATHVSYTPAANYSGPDSFSYTISDGHGGEAVAEITVTVDPVDDPPVAADDAAALDEDTAVTIDVVANDSDIDGDALAITAIAQPAHGTAAIVDATHVSYTPAADYNGPDAFSYTISDPSGATATAAVTVTVSPVNDPPVAVADAMTVDEDTGATLDVVANDRDIDGDSLAIAAVTQPAHGAASIVDAHHVRYTPAPDYHGPDGFSYTIADPSDATATATVAVAVSPVNDPPVAVDDAAGLDEDTAVTVDVVANDLDVDGDALTVATITQPAHGLAIALDGHRVQYIPAPNYNGPDALSYTISDGHGGQSTARLTLTVDPVNDPPVAVADAMTLDEDTGATLDAVANDSDVDGDTLAVASVTQPAHGTAAITGLHQVSYTPAPDYNGADSFRYTIDDGHGGQATAQVAVTVTPVNDPPVATDDAVTLAEDAAATVDVVASDSDVDGDPLTVAAVTQPAHGTAAVVDAHHVGYTPAANYNGADSFRYTIDDGHGGQATAQVAVTVTPVNDPPVAATGALNTFDDTPATATLDGSDVDGDALTFAIATPPAHGTLGPLAGNHVTYTPAAGYTGPDAFTFTAFDGQVSSAPATIQITVTRSVCGNGIREGVHEECDDGNATPGDGCEATCKLTCGSGTGADRDAVDPATGHCFVAYDGVQHGYQDAAAMCVALGGHLPTITSAGEDAAAFAAVRAGDTPWLGGDDIAVEGTFGWLTGEPFGYSHFHAGKPDNAGNADCLQYLADGTWSDAACGTGGATGTLCELELAVPTPAFATGGGGTRALAVADLNGDGYADIAAINPANNTVGVLLGDGAGGFAAPATYAIGSGPVAIAAGDFDGDGHLDLAVASATASTVSILRGTASGAFTAGASVAINAGAVAIAAADLDGDGALDLAVAVTNTVQILRGNGSGGFTVQVTGVPITSTPVAIAVGDFNRDGRVDLALTTTAAVLVVTATGGGLFNTPLPLVSSTGNRGIVARDLDGDGFLDLAVAGSNAISVWFGSAIGFGTPVNLAAASVQLVAAGDFDGDGSVDLVAVTANFATLFHRAGRTFTQAGPLVTTGGGGASFAAAASLNGDAATDLVVANATASTAGILLGGAGGLVGARALPAGTASTATVSGDFNEDGRPDLAVVDPPTAKVYLFLQNAAGALVPGATLSLVAGANPTFAVTADFNGDGHLDLAVVNVSFSTVSVMLGTGTGTFGSPANASVGSQPRRPAVADFNGDGLPDLAVPNASAVAILINTGNGRFGRGADVPAGTGPAAAVAGDFNGDGKKDVAVATTGEASVKLALGRGDGTFAAATAFPVASAGQSIAAADLDGDGKLDLAVTGTTANSVSILRGTGTGSFAAATSVAVGAQPSSVVAVDLDGDGRLDLVVGDAGTSDATVLHGSAGGGFGASSFAVGAPTSSVCVADFDHDGHLDIAAASGSSIATLLYSAR